MQLAAEERERILAEEQYRLEVRRQLETEHAPRRSRVFAFLNSAFALWLLSAIFISGLGTAFTSWRDSRVQRMKSVETIERLDSEIAYRLSRILLELSERRNERLTEVARASIVERALKSLRLPNSQQFPPLYAEYSDIALPGLLVELRRQLSDSNERQQLDAVIKRITADPAALRKLYYGADELPSAASFILRELTLPRWRSSSFRFLNCPPDNPFCDAE